MHKSRHRRLSRLLISCATLGALASQPAMAAEPVSTSASAVRADITQRDTGIDRSGRYRQEVQACRSGQGTQPLQTCLEEARNAEAARRKGQLASAGEDYLANSLARCQPLSGEARAACEARVLGFGGSSGSVAGGGMLRWVETVVLPPSEGQVTFAPKTDEPVVVVPRQRN